MANGSSEDATVIGNISGRVCDKNGNVLNDAKITDVTHFLPEAKYNLFSITKLQNEGWILSGNSDAIWLIKGDVEINLISKSQHLKEFCMRCIINEILKSLCPQ
jgi:hypothetical protein